MVSNDLTLVGGNTLYRSSNASGRNDFVPKQTSAQVERVRLQNHQRHHVPDNDGDQLAIQLSTKNLPKVSCER